MKNSLVIDVAQTIIDKQGVKAVLTGTLTIESKRPLKKADFNVDLRVEEA